MNELSILMHERSVKNLLAGRKTQTRRVIKPKPPEEAKRYVPRNPGGHPGPMPGFWDNEDPHSDEYGKHVANLPSCPYGEPGDLLYVRETFRLPANVDDAPPSECKGAPIMYEADATSILGDLTQRKPWGKTRASIHMPKWASRIWLRVKDVRVERIRMISVDDILAEGVEPQYYEHDPDKICPSACAVQMQRLWNDTHSHQQDEFGWAANPWVWVVEFEVVSTTGRPRGGS